MKTTIEMALAQRITEYLSGGGLFNPELADHVAVRDLLIDCRKALVKPDFWAGYVPEPVKPAQQEPVAKDNNNYRLDPPGLDPLYTSPPAQRKPLTLQELEAAWNAQADKFNQWGELGLDEIVAWAQAAHNIKENT